MGVRGSFFLCVCALLLTTLFSFQEQAKEGQGVKKAGLRHAHGIRYRGVIREEGSKAAASAAGRNRGNEKRKRRRRAEHGSGTRYKVVQEKGQHHRRPEYRHLLDWGTNQAL